LQVPDCSGLSSCGKHFALIAGAGGVQRGLSSDERYSVKSILDSSFRYTNSVETDLRKTFARIRRQQRTEQQAQAKADAESHLKVRLLRQKAV
jgi:hypothetical protein